MRITLVIAGLGGGGAERTCVNLANAWVARGHQVTLLTVSQGSTPSAYDIDARVKRRDIGWPRQVRPQELNAREMSPVLRGLHSAECMVMIEQLGILAMMRYEILATSPNVVVPLIDLTNIRVLAAMSETKVPVIVCEQTDSRRISMGRYQHVRDGLYRRAHAVVAPHAQIVEWFRRRGANAVAIPNPLVAPKPVELKQNSERRRLVTLARLSEEKRPALLIRAFAKIASDYPQWDLEIFGDGHLWVPILRLIDEVAPGRVFLRGFVRDTDAILGSADLFVSASWVEGFGNAIWEALACGLPVVAMDGGAPVRSLVRHGVDGLIVDNNSGEGLASALGSLMGDEEMRKAFAGRAPEVLTRFPIEASLKAWDELLDGLTR